MRDPYPVPLFAFDRDDLEEAARKDPRQVEDELALFVREVQRELIRARVAERRSDGLSVKHPVNT